MKRIFITIAIILAFIGFARPAWAFCGFYVAKADSSLYNQASQVIIARDRDRTVLTMANDYQGEVQDFALVVPVPVLLSEDQVHVGEPKIIERIDAFSAPRLVEYFDENPCAIPLPAPMLESRTAPLEERAAARGGNSPADLGVTIEDQFTVGEYDILILSAKESDGLETWLRQNEYQIPEEASALLQPYIRQGMKFFVAKVNLEEFEASGYQKLRPLMMAFESPKFMLPIRLGTMNAQSEQDLIVYLLTPSGQVELTNYRTVKVPSDVELPEFVKTEFTDFYKSMFATAHTKEQKKVAFLEYAWDMGWCDPCVANALSPEELRQAGVFWDTASRGGGSNVFITRLHVRYTRDRFPSDLHFQSTSNRENFQGRYIIRHPYRGEMNCPAGIEYQRNLQQRLEREAQTLARLTDWDIQEIRSKIDLPDIEPRPWWRRLWD